MCSRRWQLLDCMLQAGQVVSTLNASLDLPSRDDVRAPPEMVMHLLTHAYLPAFLHHCAGMLDTEQGEHDPCTSEPHDHTLAC